MTRPSIIAIDGPAASGKTTLARQLADALGYLYFDTGLMYRAVTLSALQQGISIQDEVAVTALAESLELDVQRCVPSDRTPSRLIMNGKDVTARLRSAQVDANVSAVSAYPGVRTAMTAQQRRIGERGQVVMVGRDIGTVVFPHADLKVYLDASVEERARRRWQDYKDEGNSDSYDDVLAAMRRRDTYDSQRSVAPLRAADDAIIIDTTEMLPELVLENVLALVMERNGEESPAEEGGSR